MAYFNILVPAIGICVNICAQILAYKYILIRKLLKSEYFGFLTGLTALTILQVFAYQASLTERLALACVNLIIYFCFSYIYFSFINMGETARRIRLLREFCDSPQGLTKEQVLSRYNAEEVVNIRLNRLLHNGQVISRNSRYYIGSPVMLFISKVLVLMKLIVLGKRSEFEK